MSRWRALLQGHPGSRFTEHYERAGKSGSNWAAVGGAALVVFGLLVGLTPGPGSILVLIGAAMLAARSRAFAQFLDRCEKRLRGWLTRAG